MSVEVWKMSVFNTLETLRVWFQTTVVEWVVIFLLVEGLAFNL